MTLRNELDQANIWKEAVMSLFVVFTIGYAIGGVSALVLLALTVASRSAELAQRERR